MAWFARFMEKVAVAESGCWEWLGRKTRKGYGLFDLPGRSPQRAHRLALEHLRGAPIAGLVCHSCDNPGCVNPEHLFVGRPADNSEDMVRKGRSAKGSRHSQSKLTEHEVVQMRKLWEDGVTQPEIASQFGVGRDQVSRVVNRVCWRHVA